MHENYANEYNASLIFINSVEAGIHKLNIGPRGD